ncbi:uncharacterized protein CTHT_0018660 [Thermochaetoides thermophila DSM 1495]|uniref:Uncharacterized protein n=1 Tax=Chaetomium thermophilum (strain DSM 1495 / CBS 144.50 / IMI 039719) TaxID=759272 RepID=G0S2V9_CHATD|nr:hypothetical protein CTHT_0018660 [Thermochaetoides thermophila DSM 1495]EGS22342.1 hypothetical protein CTHT_0018660 [Thermochaetoides thermophila DSM 1495]
MSSNPDAIPLRRTRSRRSIFREDFDSQHSTHYPDTLNQPATTTTPPSPTPRDLRQSAAAHEFVFGGPGQPKPRRLGLWHFLISHVSIIAALVVGIICVVVSIVYTSNLGKRVLECPDWVRECPAADEWTVTHLGTIQGVMTLVYTIGMFALGYVALAFAETAVWAVLQKQSFTLKVLDAFVSATRGKIVAVPAAVLAVRSAIAGIVLLCAVVVSLMPFVGMPLVGWAYTPGLVGKRVESGYVPGGGITEVFVQANPPNSVLAGAMVEYYSWANDPSAEPMPEYRGWYIDRKTLRGRGDFTAQAVKLQTSISCAPRSLLPENSGENYFFTNMTKTGDNSDQLPQINQDKVWVHKTPHLAVWVDEFSFLSKQQTRATLIFAAFNGTIDGGATTKVNFGNLENVSSIACDINMTAADDILTVGTNPPSVEDLPLLSSIDTLTLPSSASQDTHLNEFLLWFAVAPVLTAPSVYGNQPSFLNFSATGLPIPYTKLPSDEEDYPTPEANTWTIAGLTTFVYLSIGAVVQSTLSQTGPEPITLTTNVDLLSFLSNRTFLLLFPPLLTFTILIFFMIYTTMLHAKHSIPVLRLFSLPELLKSSQTQFLRDIAGVDAAKGYLPAHDLAKTRVRFGVERTGMGLNMMGSVGSLGEEGEEGEGVLGLIDGNTIREGSLGSEELEGDKRSGSKSSVRREKNGRESRGERRRERERLRRDGDVKKVPGITYI